MWLLSTDRAELQHFTDHLAVDGGYAILSHTWGPNEQTFQELQALREECQRTGKNPRDCAPAKIRRSCLLAESYGYRWIWIDTCCIDKTSSSELSEAINSMFRWYASAEVCYAFLEDVPTDCDLDAPDSPFRHARWHTRGWTLQELIAPQVVVFISSDWSLLGHKLQLAELLSQITGVREEALMRPHTYSRVSVAERMSWASRRHTTRLEDEAYCLMGLFNINMPTIYGEGREAFQRLQQEIMKSTLDTSLFAWGFWMDNLIPWTPRFGADNVIQDKDAYPLARSPADFSSNWTCYYTPIIVDPLQPYLPWQWSPQTDSPDEHLRRTHGPFGQLELPRFASTNYGLECRFPIIQIGELIIAVLLCEDRIGHLGLLLNPAPPFNLSQPYRKTYRVGRTFSTHNGDLRVARIIGLGNDFYDFRIDGKHVKAVWRDICIANDRAMHGDVSAPLAVLNCITPTPPFRLPLWLGGRLSALGLDPQEPDIRSASSPDSPMLMVLRWQSLGTTTPEAIWFCLGTCNASSQASRPVSRWAKTFIFSARNWFESGEINAHLGDHDCAMDHIEDWPNWEKAFGDSDRTVRLSFRRCSLAPEVTLVMHLELEGRVYKELAMNRNVVFPSRY